MKPDDVLSFLLLLGIIAFCGITAATCSHGGGSNTPHACAEACQPNAMVSWDWADGCACSDRPAVPSVFTGPGR